MINLIFYYLVRVGPVTNEMEGQTCESLNISRRLAEPFQRYDVREFRLKAKFAILVRWTLVHANPWAHAAAERFQASRELLGSTIDWREHQPSLLFHSPNMRLTHFRGTLNAS